jgi:hypothetical protein
MLRLEIGEDNHYDSRDVVKRRKFTYWLWRPQIQWNESTGGVTSGGYRVAEENELTAPALR